MPVVYSQHGVIVKTAGFDVIGGRRYNTIQMPDGKTWMAENLEKFACLHEAHFTGSPDVDYVLTQCYGWIAAEHGV